MKILNILPGTNLGGFEQSSLKIMKTFKVSGIIPIIISISPFGLLKKEIDKNEIESYCLSKINLYNIFLLFKLIIKINPDKIIMTGHSFLGIIVLGLFFRNKKNTLSVHYHHTGVKSLIVWKIYYFCLQKYMTQ